MKLTLLQFMAFAFMLGWVGTDVLNGTHLCEEMSYHDRIFGSSFLAWMTGYLNNAHGLIWRWLKKKLRQKIA